MVRMRSAAVLTTLAGVSALDPSCENGCAVGPFPAAENMNGDYTIAGNPEGFSTRSADYDPGHIEYFDVYPPRSIGLFSLVPAMLPVV